MLDTHLYLVNLSLRIDFSSEIPGTVKGTYL